MGVGVGWTILVGRFNVRDDPGLTGQRIEAAIELKLHAATSHPRSRDSRLGLVDRAIAVEIPLADEFVARRT